MKQPLEGALDVVNGAELGGGELVAKLELLVGLTRSVCETDETDPHLAVAIIGLGLEPDLDWALPNSRLLDKAVEAHLIKLIDAMRGDGLECLANESFHAQFHSYQDWLRDRVWQKGEFGNFKESIPSGTFRPSGELEPRRSVRQIILSWCNRILCLSNPVRAKKRQFNLGLDEFSLVGFGYMCLWVRQLVGIWM
jgi:hypothetical protein